MRRLRIAILVLFVGFALSACDFGVQVQPKGGSSTLTPTSQTLAAAQVTTTTTAAAQPTKDTVATVANAATRQPKATTEASVAPTGTQAGGGKVAASDETSTPEAGLSPSATVDVVEGQATPQGTEEPTEVATTGVKASPVATREGMQTPPAGTAAPMPAGSGSTIGSAVKLQPGQAYTLTAVVGQAHYFAIPVAEGQSLRASALIKAAPGGVQDFSTRAMLKVYNPLHYNVKQDSEALISKEDKSVAVETDKASKGSTDMQPGLYYVALEVVNSNDKPVSSRFESEVTLELVGNAGATLPPVTAVQPHAGVQAGSGFADAPLLNTGAYSGTIENGSTFYYAVDLLEGQSLRASALIKSAPELADAPSSKANIVVYNPVRQELTSKSQFYLGQEDKSWGLQTEVVKTNDEKLLPGRYYVSLSLQDTSHKLDGHSLSYEFILEVVGAARGKQAFLATPLPSGGAIQGTTGFAQAPKLQPGVYTNTIKPGETRYFAVEIGEGQSLRVAALLKGNKDSTDASNSAKATLTLYSTLRKQVGSDTEYSIGTEDKTVALQSDPAMSAGNDEDKAPGLYYISLAVQDDGKLQGRSLPAELVVEIVSK